MNQESTIQLRKYRASDREKVRSICFETGLMGSPVESIYGDRESFADMFSGYYTDAEPESAWVAFRSDDEDDVVGYLLGCVDSRRAWDPAKIGAKHAFLRGLLFRPSTAKFYLRLLGDVIRDGGVHRPHVDFDAYPAHFHINLLPGARGGVGLRMHFAFIEYLRERGVVGIHAEAMAQNERTLKIGKKLGYEVLTETFPIPGMRDYEGNRIRGIVTGLDLRDAHGSKALSSIAAMASLADRAEHAAITAAVQVEGAMS
jgi:hypothetical protein